MFHFSGGRPFQGSARADRENLSPGNFGAPLTLQTCQCGGQQLSNHMALNVTKSTFESISYKEACWKCISENFDISLTGCLNTYIVTWEHHGFSLSFENLNCGSGSINPALH